MSKYIKYLVSGLMLVASASAHSQSSILAALPMPPEKVWWEETDEPGMVNIHWTPVTTDIDGFPIPEGDVSYQVNMRNICLAYDIHNTIISYPIVSPWKISFVEFMVYTLSPSGRSPEPALSRFGPVGASYSMPFIPSLYPNSTGGYQQEWGVKEQEMGNFTASLSIMDADLTPAGVDSNDDGRLWAITAPVCPLGAALYSAKIHVNESAANPCLSYYVYGTGEPNTLTVSVNNEVKNHLDLALDIPAGTWTRRVIPLDTYRGSDIAFVVSGTINEGNWILFDGLDVTDMTTVDLAASINAPAEVPPFEEFEITGTVRNLGLDNAIDVVAALYRADTFLASEFIPLMPGGDTYIISAHDTLLPTDAAGAVYRLEVTSPSESSPLNNTATATVGLAAAPFPTVQIELFMNADNSPELLWEAPVIDPELLPGLEVEAYQVYRNDALIARTEATEFVDTETLEDGQYTYAVAVMYNAGVSDLSNTVTVEFVGIDSPAIPRGFTLAGRTVAPAEGAQPLSIVTPTGLTIAADAIAPVTLPDAGMYIVLQHGVPHKIAVR